MDIQTAVYTENNASIIVNGSITVPVAGGNRDYQAVLAWVAEGNTIAPYVAPPAPFAALSRPAFLFMAAKIGMTESVILGVIATMPESTQEEQDAKMLAEIVFKNQQSFERDNALLVSLAASAGLTTEQVDAAWRTAEAIEW